jgi:hypothetical protein
MDRPKQTQMIYRYEIRKGTQCIFELEILEGCIIDSLILNFSGFATYFLPLPNTAALIMSLFLSGTEYISALVVKFFVHMLYATWQSIAKLARRLYKDFAD